MTDIQVWGIRANFADGWFNAKRKTPFFTFSREEADTVVSQIRTNKGERVRVEEMTDEAIAEIPEVAAALVALYQIRTARIVYQQAMGGSW